MAQSEDHNNPIYFKIEIKREYTATTTQNLAKIPITKFIKKLRL